MTARPFILSGRTLGKDEPVFVIAEAGVNHNGDVALARRLVDAAAECGADAVKFQTFNVDALLTREAPKAGYQVETTGEGESQRDMHLLDWLTPESGVLFFASTSETYAGGVTAGTVSVPTPEDVPLTVEDIRAPRFAYAASKILGEAAVIHIARGRGLRAVTGRFHNVYGPRMKRLKESVDLCP